MSDRVIHSLAAALSGAGITGPDYHLLVAVSGGEDSMCLVHALGRMQESIPFTISLAHVNHRLRSKADRDQKFVENFARKNGLVCHVSRLNPKDRDPRENIETWARTRRYSSLQEVAVRIKADWILTAHHGNDQAETLIQRILEGSGPQGLIGIHRHRGNILRPLLDCSKNDILDYLAKYSIRFIADETNDDQRFLRNFIRKSVIPIVETRFDGLVEGTRRTAALMGETEEVIQFSVDQLSSNPGIKKRGRGWTIPNLVMQNVPLLLQVRLLQRICNFEAPFRHHDWELVKEFLQTAQTGKILTMQGWMILRDRDKWLMEKEIPTLEEVRAWNLTDSIEVNGIEFSSRKVPPAKDFQNNPLQEIVDGDALEGKSLLIRLWRRGDRFKPLGMTHFRKISDYLTDRKLDRFSKARQLVLTADGEIVWVCGQQISESIKIRPSTINRLELKMHVKAGSK